MKKHMITIIAIILIVTGVLILAVRATILVGRNYGESHKAQVDQTNISPSTNPTMAEKERFVFEKNGDSHVSKDGLTIIFNSKINKRLHKGSETTSYFFTLSLNGEKRDAYFPNQYLSIEWSGYTISKENDSPLTISIQKN